MKVPPRMSKAQYTEPQMRVSAELNTRKIFPDIEYVVERKGEFTKEGKPKNYIVDLAIPKKLFIEIDGDTHDFKADEIRDKWLVDNGHAKKVIHFPNNKALRETGKVATEIQEELDYLNGNIVGVIDPEYEALAPPMSGQEFHSLKESIKIDGQHFGIVLGKVKDRKGKVLDGHHRLRACRELGKQPYFTERKFHNVLEEKRFVIMTGIARRHLNDYEKAESGFPLIDIESKLAEERQKDGQTLGSDDLKGRTTEIVADQIGMPETTFKRAIKLIETCDKPTKIRLRNGSTTINNIYGRLQSKQDTAEDAFIPQLFNVWRFNSNDNRFGTDNYPGRIPGQIIQNLLYYYTDQWDLVVDPMAGGGTVIDVCKEMHRKVIGLDFKPIRNDIGKNDITKGYPQKCVGAKLIFIDAPYFKMKAAEYAKGSVSDLNKEGFLKFFNKLGQDSFETVADGGYVAIIMQDFLPIYESIGMESIFVADVVQYFTLNAPFETVMRIQVPLNSEQYSGQDVSRAKEAEYLMNLARDVYVFRRPEK